MKIIILIIVVIAIFIIYKLWVFRRNTTKQAELLYLPLKPLMTSLQLGKPDEVLVKKYAEDLKTASSLFRLLAEHNLLEYFPKDISVEDIGKSALASWLVHPHELDAWPDEIQFLKRIEDDVNGEKGYCLTYRYKVNEPHWAAKNGWMLGVVGPFAITDTYPQFYNAFSHVDPMGDKTPEEMLKDYKF